MIVKKSSSYNEYIYAGDVWIRNFLIKKVSPITETNLFEKSDYAEVFKNEQFNMKYPKVSDELLLFDNVVIVSDGYQFNDRHKFLSKLPKNVCILAVNKALKKWTLNSFKTESNNRRSINAFVANNPYKECLDCLPVSEKYYPTCVASTRTNNEFLSKYLGDVYTYVPTPEKNFGSQQPKQSYYIDDYRNPICAAIGLAYQFKANKVMLLCCDDSFEDDRAFSVSLSNGLRTYPQQIKSQQIIDANLYWLTHQEDKKVKVVNYSSGIDYVNATYINSEEQALSFFSDQEEGSLHVK